MSSLEDLKYQSIKDALLLLAAREDSKQKQKSLEDDYGKTVTNLALHADAYKLSKIVWYIFNEIAIDMAIAALPPCNEEKAKIDRFLEGRLKAKAALVQVLTTRKSLPVREAIGLMVEMVGEK